MNYMMYATAKNKLYSIYTDIKRGENKENVLVDILFRVEELDDNNEETKVVKELKNMYVYDPGLTDHQINDGVANMYATTIKVDADVEDEDEIKCPVCGEDVKVENVIDYDDYVIVAEDGQVFQYECSECGVFIQVFVND